MTAFIELTTALLITGGWFALAFGLAVLIGKSIAYGQRDFNYDHSHRERVGLPEPCSITSLVEERERRVNRAALAQRKRWGDAA